MTYPESANVSAGDATLASHYNNLRADGVFLGQVTADSVPLGTMLERYVTRLTVELLSTNKIRVPASADAPVSLLIDGYLCQAVANVDLDAGDVPSGAASAYYIFANRADSSTTFTLTVSTSNSEASNKRRIGRFYWDGSAIIKDSVRSDLAEHIADLLYFVDPQVCDGRLTLSTGDPIPDSDIASSANVYFTSFLGNRISLYVQDYGWRLYTFGELTLDISGVADAKNIDVWIYDNAGTHTLAYTEWSNDILRATAIIRQDGVWCKTGALGYRYLGTVRTSGAGVVCDTEAKRFTWNFNNRRPRKVLKVESTNTWAYTLATWRSANASDLNRIELVIGVSEDPVELTIHSISSSTGAYGRAVGIALDATNTNHAHINSRTGNSSFLPIASIYLGFPGIGYHYLQWVENAQAAGTCTWYGDGGDSTLIQSGLYGKVMA